MPTRKSARRGDNSVPAEDAGDGKASAAAPETEAHEVREVFTCGLEEST